MSFSLLPCSRTTTTISLFGGNTSDDNGRWPALLGNLRGFPAGYGADYAKELGVVMNNDIRRDLPATETTHGELGIDRLSCIVSKRGSDTW